MSSNDGKFHAPHYLTPEEIAILRDIVEAIAGEPWFIEDAQQRESFAREVLSMYQRGLTIPDKLHDLCELLAHKHYSVNSPSNAADQTSPT